MAKWGQNFFHKFRDKVKKQKEVLDVLVSRVDDEGIRDYFIEKNRLEEILKQEETYWQQREKTFWLAEGDSNSKKFHSHASARKKVNHIEFLRDDQGVMVENHKEMCNMAVEYFRGVFAGNRCGESQNASPGNRIINDAQNALLTKALEFDEFTKVLKQMHLDKASGPDGLTPAFFQVFLGANG